MFKVAIDAGHGPNTPGKRAPDDSMREYHFNSIVANRVSELLVQYEDVTFTFVHSDSSDVALGERVRRANAFGAHAYISIHANAFGTGFNSANGTETFVYKNTLKEAVNLANAVQANIVKIKGQANRGVKEGNFQVLRETNMTAILVEAGFMTNATELAYLKDMAYRFAVAEAIVNALAFVYGLKKKEVTPSPAPSPTPAPSNPTSTYRVIAGSFGERQNAENMVNLLKGHGIASFIEIK